MYFDVVLDVDCRFFDCSPTGDGRPGGPGVPSGSAPNHEGHPELFPVFHWFSLSFCFVSGDRPYRGSCGPRTPRTRLFAPEVDFVRSLNGRLDKVYRCPLDRECK